jgi:hypothetical protein
MTSSLPPSVPKWRKCLHDHWKECQDWPEMHMFVKMKPEDMEEMPGEAEEYAEDEDSQQEDALEVARLVSCEQFDFSANYVGGIHSGVVESHD